MRVMTTAPSLIQDSGYTNEPLRTDPYTWPGGPGAIGSLGELATGSNTVMVWPLLDCVCSTGLTVHFLHHTTLSGQASTKIGWPTTVAGGYTRTPRPRSRHPASASIEQSCTARRSPARLPQLRCHRQLVFPPSLYRWLRQGFDNRLHARQMRNLIMWREVEQRDGPPGSSAPKVLSYPALPCPEALRSLSGVRPSLPAAH